MTNSDDRDPFGAYHDSLSGPDVATTSRLETRLDAYLEHGTKRRRAQSRARLLAGLGMLAAIGAGAAWWSMSPSAEAPAVIAAEGPAQKVSLVSGGSLTVSDGGRVRVMENGAHGVLVELETGTLELETSGGAETRTRVRVATFEVEALGTTSVRVRATTAEPEVTVLVGKAVLTGPGLPAAGTEITPARE